MTPETLQQIQTIGLAGATAFGITFLLTPVVRTFAVRFGWVARPVDDRWGKRVTARLGGVAMFLGFLGATLLWLPQTPATTGLLIGAVSVFSLGLLDDVHRLRPYTKLVAQLLIGCVVVTGPVRINLPHWPWVAIPLSILWFVLVMNAFNLLDNMDGLAAGVGAIAAGFCIFHGIRMDHWVVATLAAIVAGICLGFLRYNFFPAKVFMGDSGSHLLGLSLAALALMGSADRSTQLISVLAVPMLVLAVPIFDTCFVTVQRLLHKQHPFVGGTDHVSHRLAILGLSTRQTVLALYAVSVALGMLSVLSTTVKPLATTAIWLAVVTGLVVVGSYLSQVKVYRLGPGSPAHALSAPGTGRPATLIETMLLHKRRLVEVLVDFALVSSAYVLAHVLRFEGTLTSDLQQLVIRSLPLILFIKLSCFAGCGLYRGIWRYVGVSDLMDVFKAVTLGSVLSSLALLFLWRFEGYSRAALMIDWLLTFVAVGGSRVTERLLDEWITELAQRGEPVVIIGAGDTGARVLRWLKYEVRGTRRAVGFLDDDVRKHGDRIHGVSVLGDRNRLSDVLDRQRVREVLVAIADPPADLLHHVQACCQPRSATWKVVTAGVTDAV